MGPVESVTVWLARLRNGERDEAIWRLWQVYFARLVGLARARLASRPRLTSFAEDVALSAFNSFVRAAQANRFPRLDDRDDLWRVLLLLTARKAGKLLRREGAAKRGGTGRLPAEDVPLERWPVASSEPDPAEAAIMGDTCDRLLDQLGDDTLRQVALWKLEGFSNAEIAEKLNRSISTVERKLQLIRRIWTHEEA